ncbi:MAG TPA: SDR family NAD(P)-dependent oxidoreductase [Mycobacterium sp.]|nr:SDR family NAD(P)-dependent oxidoreductase [Mycobacterium sp.]
MTGGTRGIGDAVVLRLVEAGAAVVVTGRRVESLKRVARYLRSAGAKVVGVQADAADVDAAQSLR